VVTDPAEADWAVVNTCTVTHTAARKSRQLLRQIHRANPALSAAVTGCYADVSPADVAALPGVRVIASNGEKDHILNRFMPGGMRRDESVAGTRPLESGRTRALVKIQDGCDNHCAYCIVTVARGPQRSRARDDVLAEIETRLSEGYREVVLTGVNIGAYGSDLTAPQSLVELVRAILEGTSVERLRLSSVEPWDVDQELLALWGDDRLCRHLHLPLQSGCDATLRRMGRPQSTAEFARVAALAREMIPDVSITTDLIVGFPGETEVEFAQSLAFVERMAFSRLHVFKYSRRPGTTAARMPAQVPPPVARARSDALLTLGQRLARSFHAPYEGRTVEVLFESATQDGTSVWSGLTDNYIRVSVSSRKDLHNVVAQVRCRAADEAGLWGRLHDELSPIDRMSAR
jgi:threonylcarbamoyladenosine tRNA methylthiotransferase MtaB